MMEIYWRVLLSLPKVLMYKIKYAGKCTMPWIQAFGHHTELKMKNGTARFGKEQITRGNAVFRVEGGDLIVGASFHSPCAGRRASTQQRPARETKSPLEVFLPVRSLKRKSLTAEHAREHKL